MSIVRQHVQAPPAEVFAVLGDPWTYPRWLVGAREIRSVDPDWPAPGTRFHHRVGLAGPLTVSDSTRVIEVDPPWRLVMEVRALPLGRAVASVELRAAGAGTEVTMREQPIGALATLRALLDPLLSRRNRTSLRSAAALIEAGQRGVQGTGTDADPS